MEAPVQPGDILASKYRVERPIGEGGMGVVVAARHLELGELFAIKFLAPDALSNAEAVERFLQEARASARLKGEHVTKVHDVGRLTTGALYMVMELLEGSDFKKLLQARGPLPADETAAYLVQACEAIAEAHALGIIHRDIKPANLFLANRPVGGPRVKVLDFGISKHRTPEGVDVTKTGATLGSPAYMSPEQMLRTRAVDPRSDIWSLGVVLYELVTGVSPFYGEAVTEVVARVLNEEPEPPSRVRADIPAWVDAVVLRCLKKKPDERFQTVLELAEALKSRSARRAGPLNRGALSLAAAGVIALAVGGTAWLIKAPSPTAPREPAPTSGAPITAPKDTPAMPPSPAVVVEPPPPEPQVAAPSASALPASAPTSAAKRQAKPPATAKATAAPRALEPSKHEGIY